MTVLYIIAAYIALSFTVGGLYAWGMARHRRAQQAMLATPSDDAPADEMSGDHFAEWDGFLVHPDLKPQGAAQDHA